MPPASGVFKMYPPVSGGGEAPNSPPPQRGFGVGREGRPRSPVSKREGDVRGGAGGGAEGG